MAPSDEGVDVALHKLRKLKQQAQLKVGAPLGGIVQPGVDQKLLLGAALSAGLSNGKRCDDCRACGASGRQPVEHVVGHINSQAVALRLMWARRAEATVAGCARCGSPCASPSLTWR